MHRFVITILLGLNLLTLLSQLSEISEYDLNRLEKIQKVAGDYLYNNTDSSIILFRQGLEILEQYGDKKLEANFTSGIGRAYMYKGDYQNALPLLQKAMDMYTRLKDTEGIYKARFNLALVNFYMKNLTKSEELYLSCIDYFTSENDSFRLAQTFNNLGIISIEKKELESGLEFYHKSVEIKKALNLKMEAAVTNNNIGDIYLRMRKYKEAKPVYEDNLIIAQDLNNNALLLATYIGLATIEMNTEVKESTRFYIDEAVRLSEIIQAREWQKVAYVKQAEYYAAIGDFKTAFGLYTYYHAFSDSILNENNQKALQELQIQYETEKKNKEIIVLKENENLNKQVIRQQKILIYSAVIVAALAIIVLILLSILFRKQRMLNKTLQAKNEFIENQNDELKKLNVTKDKFFSIIAHDLKNPFSTLMGFSELMVINADSLPKEKILEFAKQINDSSNRIYSLLENLLTWARTQTGKIEARHNSFNLHAAIDSINQLLREAMEEKGNTFQNNIPESIQLNSDIEFVKTIFRNLIFNANKYTEKGTISVTTEINQDTISISVNDTGVGMNVEQMKRLFKFVDLKTEKGTRNEKGTGLGMHICKELVQMLDGSIEVESEIDKGSSIRILLPYNNQSKF